LVRDAEAVLEAGIVNFTVHTFLGVVPLPPLEPDARTNKMTATTTTHAAMMMALGFILDRHRTLFLLYGLSCALPVRDAANAAL
jgi:hypothetical protein